MSAAVSEALDVIVEEIKNEISAGSELEDAVLKVLQKHIIETEPIRFEGNNYSKEWEVEAKRRGLLNIKKTGYALDLLVEKKNMELLLSKGIFLSQDEIENRYYTKLEQYITSLEIEVQTFCNLIDTRIIPAAITYQNQLITNVRGLKEMQEIIPEATLKQAIALLQSVSLKISALKKGCAKIDSTIKQAEDLGQLPEKAKFFSDKVVELLDEVRIPADELEKIVPDELWPLPKYSEMLFIM